MIDRLEHERALDPDAPRDGSVVEYVQWLMDRDRKSTPLKELQGLIWEEGYTRGDLTGDVFPDVPRALERWRRQGSGGRHLFFRQRPRAAPALLATRRPETSPAGSAGISTRRSGPKGDPASYRRIAEAMNVEPDARAVHLGCRARARRRPRRPGCRRAWRSGRETRPSQPVIRTRRSETSTRSSAQEGIHDGTSVRARQRRGARHRSRECRSTRPLQRFARASTARSASRLPGRRSRSNTTARWREAASCSARSCRGDASGVRAPTRARASSCRPTSRSTDRHWRPAPIRSGQSRIANTGR